MFEIVEIVKKYNFSIMELDSINIQGLFSIVLLH